MKPFTLWTRDIVVYRDMFSDNGRFNYYIADKDNVLCVLMQKLTGSKHDSWRKIGVWITFKLSKQYIIK